MKNVLWSFIVTLLMSLSSLAKVNFTYSDYDGVLGAIKLDNACKTETQIKTKKPVGVCTELVRKVTPGHGELAEITDWVCANSIVTDLAVDRKFKRTVCTEMKYENENFYCSKEEVKDDFIPDTIKTGYVKDALGTKTNYPGTTQFITLEDCGSESVVNSKE